MVKGKQKDLKPCEGQLFQVSLNVHGVLTLFSIS